LKINPSTNGSSAKVGVENLQPGQKIKVIVKEDRATPQPTRTAVPSPSAKPTSRASIPPRANPSVKPSNKSTSPVKVVPKPSGSSADIGISNLKPGQKIKITVKSGGTKK
jgi:hypothetical protein